MTISNGTVEYKRTVKPGDFESRSAGISLSFAVEEGSDPAIVVAKVYDMAVAEVHRRIGLNGAAYAAKVEDKPAVVKAAEREASPPTIMSSTKNKFAPDPFSMKPTAKAAPQANPTPAPDAAQSPQTDAVPTTALTPGATPTSTTASTSPSDPMAIVAPASLPLVDTPTEITATDLKHAVTHATEKKAPALAVKELICKYNGGVAGKPITDIPQEKRAAFLAELKELRA